MLDESLLDSPEALAGADTHALLRGTAEAGAHVRTAVRRATETGLTALRPDGRPRAVFVAGPGPAPAHVADLLAAFADDAVPVTLLRPSGPLAAPGALRWALPGWAGSLDLLLVATPDGAEAGLTMLIEQAYRRGCTVVTVSPADVPVAELTRETHGLAVPLGATPPAAWNASPARDAAANGATPARGAHDADEDTGAGAAVPHPQPVEPRMTAVPGLLWSMLTPLLVLFDRVGLFAAGEEELEALADRLDHVAERCGPAVAAYSNPAKSLAAELSETFPLLWSEGALAGAVARHSATTLAALPGLPALAAALPEAMAAHGALLSGALSGGSGIDDFFRDRVEEPESLRARIVLLRDRAPGPESAVVAARDLAYAHDAPLSELEPAEGSSPLEATAELIATADFAAVYLALADSGTSSP
ncbi:SIS domain-containing protein [Streptomyces sp. WMMB 322]|uniref:SIS domain-containing protein n=1 Tax=Streptomyces sp. WMMB 322 TaxID=1286821 RepID=UPI0006E2D95E|nr:SIS domain-containing protein [Streptomyces sp. WMMB 322]SCK11327.1 phospho-glucose isomerase C-terminal SIS domain-containing protein [Streptomyces sp. WMMB 322]